MYYFIIFFQRRVTDLPRRTKTTISHRKRRMDGDGDGDDELDNEMDEGNDSTRLVGGRGTMMCEDVGDATEQHNNQIKNGSGEDGDDGGDSDGSDGDSGDDDEAATQQYHRLVFHRIDVIKLLFYPLPFNSYVGCT